MWSKTGQANIDADQTGVSWAWCDARHTHQLSFPAYGGRAASGDGAAMHDKLNLVVTIIGLSFLITATYEGLPWILHVIRALSALD
jgi:hypothetical protein